jgi:hypothetical protein
MPEGPDQGRRLGAASAGRGGADFVGRLHDPRAAARSLRPAKLGGPRILEAGPLGMAVWKDRETFQLYFASVAGGHGGMTLASSRSPLVKAGRLALLAG